MRHNDGPNGPSIVCEWVRSPCRERGCSFGGRVVDRRDGQGSYCSWMIVMTGTPNHLCHRWGSVQSCKQLFQELRIDVRNVSVLALEFRLAGGGAWLSANGDGRNAQKGLSIPKISNTGTQKLRCLISLARVLPSPGREALLSACLHFAALLGHRWILR